MMRRSKMFIAVLCACHLVPAVRSSDAALQTYFEMEPNNSFLTAQAIPPFGPAIFTVQMVGGITPGDVDIYSVTLPAPISLSAFVPLVGPPHTVQLGVFDASGTPIQVINWSGPGGAFLSPTLSTAGTYFIGVSGASVIPLSGDHQETFDYNLSLSYFFVPAPGALPLLGLTGLLGRTRRR